MFSDRFLGFIGSRKWLVLVMTSLLALVLSWWLSRGNTPVDFKYFWLSGKLWITGLPPYGPELQTLGEQAFPESRVNPFFYPPNWVVVSSLLAMTDAQTSILIWTGVSTLALVLASWQIAFLMERLSVGWSVVQNFAATLFGLAVVTHGTTVAINIGQPTLILLCAFTSLLIAILRGERAVATIALIVLLLKPQFSIPIVLISFVFIPWSRKCVAVACLATAVMALVGLGWSNPDQTLSQFLDNLSVYRTLPENWSIHMSGPNFAFALFGMPVFSAFVWLAIALTVCLSVGLIVNARFRLSDPETAVQFLVCVGVWTLFLMPTHNSDLVLVAPIILLLASINVPFRILLLVGLFLIMRAYSLSAPLEGFLFKEKTVWLALFDTAGLFSLTLVSTRALLSEINRSKNNDLTTL